MIHGLAGARRRNKPGGGVFFTSALSPRIPVVKAQSNLLVVFAVSGRRLALPAAAIAEIVPEPRLTAAPAMPPVVAGMFSLRGRVVPVVRLDRLLDLAPPRPGPFRVLLVMEGGEGPWALLAERVETVVAPATLAPVPSDSAFDDCVVGMLADGDDVAVLSPERLLRRREALALAAFAARAQARWQEFDLGHG